MLQSTHPKSLSKGPRTTPRPSHSMALVMLFPPPAGVFDSLKNLIKSAQDWARSRGYALVIRGSDGNRVFLMCDRGGEYRKRHNLTDDARQRKTATRKCKCLFMLLGSRDTISDRWSLSVLSGQHNHDPSTSPAAHPSLRKLNNDQREGLAALTASAVLPRTIGTIMRQKGAEDTLIMKDIYNARQRIRSGLLNGRTPMQALVESFQADDFVWNVDRDGSGHVTHQVKSH